MSGLRMMGDYLTAQDYGYNRAIDEITNKLEDARLRPLPELPKDEVQKDGL
jgi:hypothetical protein